MFNDDIWDNRFKLRRHLGTSYLASVWSADDQENDDKPVVIKRPISSSQEGQEALKEEAARLKKFANLGIVPTLCWEARKAPYYLVMEDVRESDKAGRRRISLSEWDSAFFLLEVLLLLQEVGKLLEALEKHRSVHGQLTANHLFWERHLGLKVIGWGARGHSSGPESDLNRVISSLLPELMNRIERWPDDEWQQAFLALSEQSRKEPSYRLRSFRQSVSKLLRQLQKQIESHKGVIRRAWVNANDSRLVAYLKQDIAQAIYLLEHEVRQAMHALRMLRLIDPTDSDLPEVEKIVAELRVKFNLGQVWFQMQEGDWSEAEQLISSLLAKIEEKQATPGQPLISEQSKQAAQIAYWLCQVMSQAPAGCPSITELLHASPSFPPQPNELWQKLKDLYLAGNCDSQEVHLLLSEIGSGSLPLSLRISYLRLALQSYQPPAGCPTGQMIAKRWHDLYTFSNQVNLASLVAGYQGLKEELDKLEASNWGLKAEQKFKGWTERARLKLIDLQRMASRTSRITDLLQHALKGQQHQASYEVEVVLKTAYKRDSESSLLKELWQQAISLNHFMKELEEIDIQPDDELSETLHKIQIKINNKSRFLFDNPTLEGYLAWFHTDSPLFLANWQEAQNFVKFGDLEEARALLDGTLATALKGLGPPLADKLEKVYLNPYRWQLEEAIEWMEGLQKARQAFSAGRWLEAPQLLKDSSLPDSLLQNGLKQQEEQARLLRQSCHDIKQALRAWQEGRYQQADEQAKQSVQNAQALQEVDISSLKELARALELVVQAKQAWSPPDEATEAESDAVLEPLRTILKEEEAYRPFLGQRTQTEERIEALEELLHHLQSDTSQSELVAYIDNVLNKENNEYFYRTWLEQLKSKLTSLES